MTSLLRILLVAVALVATSCTPSYVVVPASGGSMATTNGVGLTFNAVPNAWVDDPSDLSRYMTPIWVQLINRGKQDVRVTYSDFALTNSSGFRYAAISPYPQKSSGAPAATQGDSKETSEWYFDKGDLRDEQVQFAPAGDGTGSVELVRYGGRMGGGRMGGGHLGGGHLGGHFGGHVGGHFGGHVYVGPRHGGGFYGYPHYYGYWGYYSPWPYFYAWPPYYGPYVYYWGPRYYPEGPTEAVMARGLPEGVLHPGGTVSGYVYFQHAANQTTGLDLSFVVNGADGKRLTTLHVPLEVVED